MTEAAKGYLVRDAEATGGRGRKVDQIYPYTLRGLTEALEEARFRSHSGAPQVLAILGTGNTRVIRRFEDGREVPIAPLPRPRMRNVAFSTTPDPLVCGNSTRSRIAFEHRILFDQIEGRFTRCQRPSD